MVSEDSTRWEELCPPCISHCKWYATCTETEHKVEGRLLLNVIVREGAAVLKLFPSKDQALLAWENAFLILDLRLHIVNQDIRAEMKM